jgi:8-oxo-dGTP diphosphatase
LVELGESLETAVLREAKEETSLEVSNPRLLDVVDNVDLDERGRVKYHFVIVDYLVTAKGVETLKAASDAEDLKWVPFDQVEAYDLTRSFRAFFKRNRKKFEKPLIAAEE